MIYNTHRVSYAVTKPLDKMISSLIKQMLDYYQMPSEQDDVVRLITVSGMTQFCKWLNKHTEFSVELATWDPPYKNQSPYLILDFEENEALTLELLKFSESPDEVK